MWMREQRWESGSQVIVSARPYTVCGDRVRRCSEREHLQDHIRYAGTELGDAVSGEYLQDHIRYTETVVGDAVSGEYLQDHIRYTETVVGDAVSESVFKTIYDMRGWR